MILRLRLKEQPKETSEIEQPKPEPAAVTPVQPAQRTVEPDTRTVPAEVMQAQVPSAAAARDKGWVIKWQVFSSGTMIHGTSSKYQLSLAVGEMDGSVGQLAAGEGSSESYGVGSGFWQGVGPTDHPIRGDANRDDIINVGDVVYLVTYLYRGGPAPDPICVGDANSDDIVNVGDVVYLVTYLYRGGPPPVDDC